MVYDASIYPKFAKYMSYTGQKDIGLRFMESQAIHDYTFMFCGIKAADQKLRYLHFQTVFFIKLGFFWTHILWLLKYATCLTFRRNLKTGTICSKCLHEESVKYVIFGSSWTTRGIRINTLGQTFSSRFSQYNDLLSFNLYMYVVSDSPPIVL